MKSLKIQKHWVLLIMLIYSGCNFQTNSVETPKKENKQPTDSKASLWKKEREEKLESELYSILPDYHKEFNWVDSLALIYKVSDAYKALKPNPGHFFVKSGKSWACFTFYFPVRSETEFVELKSDNHYYYIGEKEINRDSTQQPKALSPTPVTLTPEEIEDGIQIANFLPATEEQEFELFDTSLIPDQYVGELSKQFRGYKKVYRIPRNGGWAQTIIQYLKDNPKGAVPIDGPYDEKWRDEFKVEIIRKDIE